jgi:GNAT superfamily N-acetyltransferase
VTGVERSRAVGTLSSGPAETAVVNDSTRETVREHWAALLDCDPATVFAAGPSVVPTTTEAVEMFSHDAGAVVAAPPSLAGEVRSVLAARSTPTTATEARALVEATVDRCEVDGGPTVEEVLGPQFVGYCDESTFSPVHGESPAVELVDPASLASLRAATPAAEWDRSGVRTDDDDPTVAVEHDGRPVAAAQYAADHGTAGIGVVSHPDHRGEGNATLAVSLATAHALAVGLVPEYRTLEAWSSSVALAERLGFERVGRSLLVELDGVE